MDCDAVFFVCGEYFIMTVAVTAYLFRVVYISVRGIFAGVSAVGYFNRVCMLLDVGMLFAVKVKYRKHQCNVTFAVYRYFHTAWGHGDICYDLFA